MDLEEAAQVWEAVNHKLRGEKGGRGQSAMPAPPQIFLEELKLRGYGDLARGRRMRRAERATAREAERERGEGFRGSHGGNVWVGGHLVVGGEDGDGCALGSDDGGCRLAAELL